MKILKRSAAFFAITLNVISASVFAIFDFNGAERQYCDAGVYDMLNSNLIEIYETEIAGEEIVSNKSTSQLERMANRFGVTVAKLKAIMLLQDLASKTGQSVSLSELAEMSDIKLLGYFKQCAKEYLAAVPEERRVELEQMLKGAIK